MDLTMLNVPQICTHGTFGLDLLQTFLDTIGRHDSLRTKAMTDIHGQRPAIKRSTTGVYNLL